MSKIKILPEILSNKIAAGEVVERPASVVKELCENALDAKSTRIKIEIKKGGASLIRVSDNGIGMTKDDALLSIERYATSKIYTEKDLFSIKTMGFRGEALPSIASVSKFNIITREKNADFGTRIEISGGKIKRVSDFGAPPGTMIEVGQLFFNTPARRKFLKSINTETSHIIDTISAIALGWHKVAFSLIHNKKVIKNFSECADPFDRTADVLSQNCKGKLFKIDIKKNDIKVSGWAAKPEVNRRTTRGIYAFVNNRFVKDRKINYAILNGFKGNLMKGCFPYAVIFINLSYNDVDVNVHPTKHEVRFAKEKEVFYAVSEAVANGLNETQKERWNYTENNEEKTSDFVYEKTDVYTSYPRKNKDYTKFEQLSSHVNNKKEPVINDFEKNYLPKQKSFIKDSGKFSKLDIIGQFLKTYILCESEKGIVLIDQHAAHERIIFEQLKSSNKKQASQRLIIPEIVEMAYAEADIIRKICPKFLEFGLAIEPFGGNTFSVKAVPVVLSKAAIAPVILEIAENTADKRDKHIEDIIETSLITMACHGAIRANQTLSEQEMKNLLIDLDLCENPSQCPHGRPVWVYMTQDSIEKMFKRK